jgi:hypothetical protein
MENRELLFIDFVVLSIIIEGTRTDGQPPSFNALFNRNTKESQVNNWLTEECVDLIRATPLTGLQGLEFCVKRLRDAGLLTASGSLQPTPEAADVLERIGSNWKKWPVRVQFDATGINWFDAEYAPTR